MDGVSELRKGVGVLAICAAVMVCSPSKGFAAEDHSNKPCTCKFSRKVGRSEVRMRLVGPPCKYWQRSKTYFLICQSQSLSRFYHLQDLFAIQGFDVARLNFGAPGQFSYADLNHLAGI